MKKVLSTAILVLTAMVANAQYTQQAQIDFINNTGVTIRVAVDGNAACSGDLIPNGTCTEHVSAGTHTLSASAPGYETMYRNISVNAGDHKTWAVGTAGN